MESNSEEILKALIDAIKAELLKNEYEDQLHPIIFVPHEESKLEKWLSWFAIAVISIGILAVISLLVCVSIRGFTQL